MLFLCPEELPQERLENIQKLGADAWITDVNYDATVAMAADMAEKRMVGRSFKIRLGTVTKKYQPTLCRTI